MDAVNSAPLSIIVPVGPGDSSWKVLLKQFVHFDGYPFDPEIIFIGLEENQQSEWLEFSKKHPHARWLVSPVPGRAEQLNFGVKASKGKWLWFLHADSQFSPAVTAALLECIKTEKPVIYFFDLLFDGVGGAVMRINELGVWIRSHLLASPFGDQGFLMARETFLELGPFDCEADYGEDHLLIWRAHRSEVPVRQAGSTLKTSSRKYKQQGWFGTTSKHMYLWIKQAFPNYLLYREMKIKRFFKKEPS